MHPHRIALVSGEEAWSYDQLDRAANQIANMLRAHRVGAGQRVAVSIPHSPYSSAVYFGILKAGATVVPLSTTLDSRDIACRLEDSSASAYLVFEGDTQSPLSERAREAAQRVPRTIHIPFGHDGELPWTAFSTAFVSLAVHAQHTATVLYTAAATGQTVRAELGHRDVGHNALSAAAVLSLNSLRPDTVLCVLPLSQSFGQSAVQNAAIAAGSTAVMMPHFAAEAALRAIHYHRVTVLAGVREVYATLLVAAQTNLEYANLRPSLRVAASLGPALPVHLQRAFQHRFGITILDEGWWPSQISQSSSVAEHRRQSPVRTLAPPTAAKFG